MRGGCFPAVRSHALGLGCARRTAGSRGLPEFPLQLGLGRGLAQAGGSQGWKWHPPQSLMSAVTLDVLDGNTVPRFPEMLGMPPHQKGK